MAALALCLLLAGHPARGGTPLVIEVDAGVPDAGAPPVEGEDRLLLDDLDLLRQYELLKVYPLLVPQ